MFTCSHTIAQQVSLFQSIGTKTGCPAIISWLLKKMQMATCGWAPIKASQNTMALAGKPLLPMMGYQATILAL
jgi:hypothetical protein